MSASTVLFNELHVYNQSARCRSYILQYHHCYTHSTAQRVTENTPLSPSLSSRLCPSPDTSRRRAGGPRPRPRTRSGARRPPRGAATYTILVSLVTWFSVQPNRPGSTHGLAASTTPGRCAHYGYLKHVLMSAEVGMYSTLAHHGFQPRKLPARTNRSFYVVAA
jgi:hypothetical protein